jgi:hypothetical protein
MQWVAERAYQLLIGAPILSAPFPRSVNKGWQHQSSIELHRVAIQQGEQVGL